MSRRAVIALRVDLPALAALDRMAKEAEVSRAAMAERLLVEGLNDPDVGEVREEARAARVAATEIKARLLHMLGREVEKMLNELK